MPYMLCWYQRIAMLSLGLILGLSLWRRNGMAHAYTLPFVLAELVLASWHSGLNLRLISEPVAPCTTDGPSCSIAAQFVFGFRIPYLFLAAFVAILANLIVPKGKLT